MTPSPAGPPEGLGRLTLLDHPADVRLRLEAVDGPALYRTAVAALAAVLTDRGSEALTERAPTDRVALSLTGTDPADLLACLLNEALFHFEQTGALPVCFDPRAVSTTTLTGTLGLAPLDPKRAGELLAIKAATYGELRWTVDDVGAVRAEITLDL